MGNNGKKRGGNAKKSNRRYQTVDDGEDKPSFKGKNHHRNGNHHKNKSRRYEDNNDEYTKLKKTLDVDGMDIVDMSPDGNCLFRSLSDQLFGDYGNAHYDVRSAVCDFMEQNEGDFRLFLVFEDEDDDDQDEEDARDFEDYIDSMRQDGEWGGNLEVVAAARLYRRSITVYSEILAAFTIDHGGKKPMGPDLLVSYHDNDHYNSVRNRLHPPKPSRVVIPSNHHSRTKSNGHKPRSELQSMTNSLSKSCISSSNSNTVPMPKNVKRSAPCPCGSGLRYKKCCLAKQKQTKRMDRIKGRREIEEEGFSEGCEDRGENLFRVVAI